MILRVSTQFTWSLLQRKVVLVFAPIRSEVFRNCSFAARGFGRRRKMGAGSLSAEATVKLIATGWAGLPLPGCLVS